MLIIKNIWINNRFIIGITIFIAIFLNSCAQLYYVSGAKYYPKINYDTINRRDSNNRRMGYWVDCFNKNLNYPSNKKEAVYYRYVYFYHGTRIFPTYIGSFFKLNRKQVLKFSDGSISERKDTIVLLNGKHQLYSEKGILLGEDYYHNGILEYSKGFYENGQVSTYIDYRNKYIQKPFSCLFMEYSKDGQIIYNEYWYFEGNKMIAVKQ